MRAVDLIIKKRDGYALTGDEIRWLIEGYTSGSVADEQMSAWAMAVVLRGMEPQETTDLTLAMAASGEQLDLHDLAPLTVDKHSTGGIGDKTSLVLVPLLAAVGLPVAKMSGRGLGFTGGTLDKLESIPGVHVDLTADEFRRAVRELGLIIGGQSADLAPADKKLYALRDVTGTVDSIPLIAASIMSKKLASGADCIVLDVKFGRGAFMKTLDDARELARTMVDIGQRAGRRVSAALTSMDQPLGNGIGNVLEVREAIATLRGHGPADLRDLCVALGAELAVLAGKAADTEAASELLLRALDDGSAWGKFRQLIEYLGGDLAYIDAPNRLAAAPVIETLGAPQAGYLAAIDSLELGLIAAELGGGRQRKEDAIDYRVGLVLKAKVGDQLDAGAALLELHAAQQADVDALRERTLAAFTLSDQPVTPPPLIVEIIR